jgi:hypothetical protein
VAQHRAEKRRAKAVRGSKNGSFNNATEATVDSAAVDAEMITGSDGGFDIDIDELGMIHGRTSPGGTVQVQFLESFDIANLDEEGRKDLNQVRFIV